MEVNEKKKKQQKTKWKGSWLGFRYSRTFCPGMVERGRELAAKLMKYRYLESCKENGKAVRVMEG